MINIERIEEEVKASPSQEEKLRMIADTYGLELQIYKLIEECGELVTAAAKYDPHDYRTGYHLAEEMAMDEIKETGKWYEDVPYRECKSIIKERLTSMSRDFISVGYYLKYIRDKKLYKEDGYASVWEFAEDNYGIKTSTASRWMAMNDKFSRGGNTPLLDDRYQDFGKSQLQEMLYLTDDQMEQAKPEMPAKEIRAIRKPEKKLDVEPEPERLSPLERGCITGWSQYPDFCSCCGYNGAECCNQCDERCNGRCGWIDKPYMPAPEEKAPSEDELCSKCKLNGNKDAGILECHPEKGEHKCVIDYKEAVAPAQEESESIDALDFSVRVYNVLKRSGIDTVEQLQDMSDYELTAFRGMSKKCLDEIHNKLEAYNVEEEKQEVFAPAQQEEPEPEQVSGDVIGFEEDEPGQEWPEMLADIPVFPVTIIKDYLEHEERDMTEYLEVDGLPFKVLSKKQMTVAGLRLLLELVSGGGRDE